MEPPALFPLRLGRTGDDALGAGRAATRIDVPLNCVALFAKGSDDRRDPGAQQDSGKSASGRGCAGLVARFALAERQPPQAPEWATKQKKKGQSRDWPFLTQQARPAGFEPTTPWFVGAN